MLCVSWSKITQTYGRVSSTYFGGSVSTAVVAMMGRLVTAAPIVPLSSTCR